MNILFVVPLLTLFGVPLAWADDAWRFSRSPSAAPTAVESSVASTTHPAQPHTAAETPAPQKRRMLRNEQSRLPATYSPPARTTQSHPPATEAESAQAARSSAEQPVGTPGIAALEAAVMRIMNRERALAGLPLLQEDDALSTIARAHSADMGLNDFFDHTNTAGCNSSCRATHAGYPWQSIGENIYTMQGFTLSPEEAAEKIVRAWMLSSGHRANILGSYSHTGIGIWHAGDELFATALYAQPRAQ